MKSYDGVVNFKICCIFKEGVDTAETVKKHLEEIA